MQNKKAITWGLGAFGFLIVLFSTIGINDNGYRTVVQWPNGTTFVKFKPGIYLTLFGSAIKYPDEMTFDYDDGTSGGTLSEKGISVRYQDGGTGTTFGKLRVRLPTDEETMLSLHRSVRSARGFANRIIRPTVKEAHQMTAGLMTSEAAYAEKRGTYIQWVDAQLRKGKYVTELVKKKVTDEAGRTITKLIPTIKVDKKTGQPIHTESVFQSYGVTIGSSPLTDWDFEKKTRDQISTKREATMAIITAKANAERAKQDAITAEQQGLADVKKAQYEEEVAKIKQVVIAEREKEVAVIAAEKLVEVAKQTKLEAEQLKLAAYETKKKHIALGQGLAEKKRLIFQADGALKQKLQAWKEVNFVYAKEFGKQKWVSEVTMGSNGGNVSGSAAMNLIELMTVNNAKQLSLDMKMGTAK